MKNNLLDYRTKYIYKNRGINHLPNGQYWPHTYTKEIKKYMAIKKKEKENKPIRNLRYGK